jgi:hypothetical protein
MPLVVRAVVRNLVRLSSDGVIKSTRSPSPVEGSLPTWQHLLPHRSNGCGINACGLRSTGLIEGHAVSHGRLKDLGVDV